MKDLEDIYTLLGQLTLNNMDVNKGVIEFHNMVLSNTEYIISMNNTLKDISKTLKNIEERLK